MKGNRELFPGAGDLAPLADINVTPFIDIMLVLLIIFMVTAPLMLGGVAINLPKTAGQALPRPDQPLVVSLDADSRVFIDQQEVAAAGRAAHFQELARASAGGEVYVRGDGEVKYARMMELMAELGQAGFARVTLVASVTGSAPAAKDLAASTPESGLTAAVSPRP